VVPTTGKDGANLVEFCITFCEVHLSCVKWIWVNYAHDTRLEKLVLSDNSMCDEEIEIICKIFQTNRSITHLDISSNQFGVDATANICNSILNNSANNVLRTLVIESNNLQNAGAFLLCDALRANTRLCALNVAHNKIGGQGILRLADLLLGNTVLNVLSIAKNYSNTIAQAHLHRALQCNTRLLSLDVSGLVDEDPSINESGSDLVIQTSAVDTVTLIAACKNIQYLRLDNIHTSVSLMQRIQVQLSMNTVLRRISFASCGLTLETAYVFARGMSINKSITQIDLSDNQLCELAGVAHHDRVLDTCFWDMLAQKENLEILALRGNALGTRTVWHAADFLAKNKTLKVLDVADNGIGSIGALVMLHAISRNKSLQVLDMTQNASFPESYSRLLSAILRSRICAQEATNLHVRGIPLFVSAREMRHFLASASHNNMQITKNDLLTTWDKDCHTRKVAFLLLTRRRLCVGLLTQLYVDCLRLILSYDILFA